MTFLSNIVAPDYFHTLKIGVLAGREFTRPDDAGAMPVAIVNRTLAERFWGGASQAIGKRLRVQTGEWRTVVGVVRDIKYSRINEARRPYVYLPFLQFYDPMMLLHARGSVGTAALLDTLRRHVQARDPELPILGARTLAEQTQSALAFLDMAAGALFTFGIAGIALAALGIYGLISYSVAQSAQEIGIRMALGARRSEVVWHYLRRGLRLGAIGAAVGIVAALASTRLLSSLLYGISATDLASFVVALVVVLFSVSVATIVPAWRAVRSGPMAALLRG